MPSYCPNCGAEAIEDCECKLCDSDCITVDGNGDVGREFTFHPRFDDDPDNLASESAAGLLAELPSWVRNPPRCHVYNSAALSNPNDEDLLLTFDSERYDSDTMHSTVTDTDQVIFTTAGIYVVVLNVTFAGAAAGDRKASIYYNGIQQIAQVQRRAGAVTFDIGLNVVTMAAFNAGDYIQARTRQDSGGAINVVASRSSPILATHYLRPIPTS